MICDYVLRAPHVLALNRSQRLPYHRERVTSSHPQYLIWLALCNNNRAQFGLPVTIAYT